MFTHRVSKLVELNNWSLRALEIYRIPKELPVSSFLLSESEWALLVCRKALSVVCRASRGWGIDQSKSPKPTNNQQGSIAAEYQKLSDGMQMARINCARKYMASRRVSRDTKCYVVTVLVSMPRQRLYSHIGN